MVMTVLDGLEVAEESDCVGVGALAAADVTWCCDENGDPDDAVLSFLASGKRLLSMLRGGGCGGKRTAAAAAADDQPHGSGSQEVPLLLLRLKEATAAEARWRSRRRR